MNDNRSLYEILARPVPVDTTEAKWDEDTGCMFMLAVLSGLQFGGTICDAKIREFGAAE